MPQGFHFPRQQGGPVLQRAAHPGALLRPPRGHDRGGREVGRGRGAQLGGAPHQRGRVSQPHPRHSLHEVEDDICLRYQGPRRRLRGNKLFG